MAEPNWKALIGTWVGVPEGVTNKKPRVLNIVRVDSDGRIEGNYWGPTLERPSPVPLAPTSMASRDKEEICLALRIEEVAPAEVDLTYESGSDSLVGELRSKFGSSAGKRFPFILKKQ